MSGARGRGHDLKLAAGWPALNHDRDSKRCFPTRERAPDPRTGAREGPARDEPRKAFCKCLPSTVLWRRNRTWQTTTANKESPMTRPVSFSTIAAVMLVSSAAAPVTPSGLYRVWVSGHGTDGASCGSPTSPCRTLQYAHDNIVLASGEIDILDPAGYGAVTITKALSIVNDGMGTAGVQQANASSAAITINAGASDAIYLRGLNIDGLGTGQDGIVFNSGGSLTVTNCVVRHFAQTGILVQTHNGTSLLSISNTIASDNAVNGIDITPSKNGSVKGTITGVDASRNAASYGIWVSGDSTSGTATFVMVSDSNLSSNGTGIAAAGAGVRFGITRVIVTNNSVDGVGTFNGTSGVPTAYTWGDNRVSGNTRLDINGNLTAVSGK